jgi:hypothetical protein
MSSVLLADFYRLFFCAFFFALILAATTETLGPGFGNRIYRRPHKKVGLRQLSG